MELAGVIILFYGLMFLGVAAAYGLGIWAIVDAAKRPEWAFRMANTEKTLWIVLLAVLLAVCWVADLVLAPIYLFSIRPRVQEAEARGNPWWPPPYGYGAPPQPYAPGPPAPPGPPNGPPTSPQ